MQKLTYSDGQVIFKQGDVTERMYVVEQGTVGIYRNFGSANEKMLAQLGVGKSFAETAVVSSHPRTVTTVAIGDVIVSAYAKEDMILLQQEKPELLPDIIRELSERLRGTTDQLMEACRTIAESMDEKERKNNKSLLARLKKFADMYDEACRNAYALGSISDEAANAVTAYSSFATVTKR